MFNFEWEVRLGEPLTPLTLGDLDPIVKVIWYIFITTDSSMFKFEWEVPLGGPLAPSKVGYLDPIVKVIWYIFRTNDSMFKFE